MMKKLLITLSVVCACAYTSLGQVQTNTVTPTPIGTTTIPILLGSTWDTLVGQGMTNLTVATVATYTPSLKEWGGGLVIARNLPLGGGISTGIGLGVDYYAKNFYAVSGQLSLEAATRPFASWGGMWTNIVFTPYTFVGLGTPIGGSESSGNLETIIAAGGSIHLMKLLGGGLNVTALVGDREGIGSASGEFYGGGLAQVWRF